MEIKKKVIGIICAILLIITLAIIIFPYVPVSLLLFIVAVMALFYYMYNTIKSVSDTENKPSSTSPMVKVDKKKTKKIDRINYDKSTDATWVLPFLKSLMDEYYKTISQQHEPWIKRIPAIKYQPVGFRIVLSQYQGLMIYFLKKSNAIQYFTFDKPLNGNIKIGNTPMNFQDTTHGRVKDEKEDYFQLLICGSEKEEYLSPKRGKEEGHQFAEEDLIYYKPASQIPISDDKKGDNQLKTIRKKEKDRTVIDETVLLKPKEKIEWTFEFKEGDILEGMADEVDGDTFNIWMFDRKNYAQWKEKGSAKGYGKNRVKAYPIDWTIDQSGLWYLFIENNALSYDREVRIKIIRKIK